MGAAVAVEGEALAVVPVRKETAAASAGGLVPTLGLAGRVRWG